jgi:hypothetical protein
MRLPLHPDLDAVLLYEGITLPLVKPSIYPGSVEVRIPIQVTASGTKFVVHG